VEHLREIIGSVTYWWRKDWRNGRWRNAGVDWWGGYSCRFETGKTFEWIKEYTIWFLIAWVGPALFIMMAAGIRHRRTTGTQTNTGSDPAPFDSPIKYGMSGP